MQNLPGVWLSRRRKSYKIRVKWSDSRSWLTRKQTRLTGFWKSGPGLDKSFLLQPYEENREIHSTTHRLSLDRKWKWKELINNLSSKIRTKNKRVMRTVRNGPNLEWRKAFVEEKQEKRQFARGTTFQYFQGYFPKIKPFYFTRTYRKEEKLGNFFLQAEIILYTQKPCN